MAETSRADIRAYVPKLLREWPDGLDHRTMDGTLVHIDISGFTAMSERLAAKGRVGAEEVARVLNTVFTELLTIASGLGADMLKFGGDALLLLFTGEGHGVRAVRASGEMRSRLRTVGKVDTPAGKVALKMTVGVHSGVLQMFVVGSFHRELIMAGDAATRVVEMEETAVAGQIVVSEATAAALPAGHIGEKVGNGFLLKKVVPPMEAGADDSDTDNDPVRFIPPALRQIAAAATADGEHRTITVAFVKFHGTDALLREDGPDALCASLNDLVTISQAAATEYGIAFLATDIDRDGGKIILTAGSPIATGSDEERVLRAVRHIMDRYTGLPLRVGVNRGPAFSGDVGAPFRRTFTVIGDAVNLSARVMARAEDGQILSTAGALDRSATLFERTPVEPFLVKGKTEPVEAWIVGSPTERRGAGDDATPLIGRDAELAQVEEALAGMANAGLIDVVGPSGIGKSRFIRELRNRTGNRPWFFTAAEQFEESTPYYPYQRLLREVLEIPLDKTQSQAIAMLKQRVGKSLPEAAPWLPLIGTVMNLPIPETKETKSLAPKFRITRIHETVERLLSAILDKPAGMIIEDAHWIDDASRDLSSYLGTKGSSRPWTLVLVRRPSDLALSVSEPVAIELGPLQSEDAMVLAGTILEDTPMLASQLAPIVERSGGNPLFLQELLKAARSNPEDADLPDSVEGLVLSRIDKLDPAHRKLLRYASVVGLNFDVDLLADAIRDIEPAVSDQSAWDALDEFIVGGKGGDMRFRQELFHAVAYSGLPYRTRRHLHERVGLALEAHAGDQTDDHAERLAVHFMRAEVYDKAWHYSLIAGNRAKEKYGNADAIDSYGRALKAARHLDLTDDEVAGVAEILGDVSEISGLYDEADHAFGAARKHIAAGSRTTAITRLMRKQGLLREKRGEYSQALRWFSRALHGLNGAPVSNEGVEVRLAYAGVRFRQARYRETIRWAAEALEIAEAQRDKSGVAHAYSLLGLAHRRLGSSDKAIGYLRDALALYEDLGDLVGQANSLNNLGGADYYMGDWELASERWAQCTEVRQRAGDAVGAAMTQNNIANIRSDQGRLDEAARLLRAVRRELRAAGFSLGAAVVSSNLGRVAARDGRFDEARTELEGALADLQGIGAEQFVLEAKAHLAEAYLFAGDGGETERLGMEVLSDLKGRAGNPELQALAERVVGYARLLKGDVPAARHRFETSLELATASDAQYEKALTLEALASLPGSDATVDDYTAQAREIMERLGVVATPKVPIPALAG